MVQPQYSPQEALERVKLMMSYDMGKTLNENREIIFEQGKAIRNEGAGLGSLESLLSNLNPKKLSKLPTKSNGGAIINLGTQNIENIQIKTNIGNLYFFAYKPGGYFTQNNFVLVVKDGVATIGSWDLTNLYFKKQGDTSFTDSGFGTNTIPLSYLKKQEEVKVGKKEENKQQVKRQYVACSGTDEQPFKKLCYEKDPNGPLHKVQSCLGLTPDGKFWNKTEQALVQKTGKNSFTINDVNTICGTKPDTQKPSIDDEFGTGEEEASSILDQ
jgi:hypothetical protein